MAGSWDQLIEDIDWEERSLRTVPDWFVDEINEEIDGGSILNVAPGDGSIEDLIESPIVSADINRERVRNTRTPIQADAEQLPFATGSFDGAISIETIEHLANPEQFADEIYRVLRPGSPVFIKTPNKIPHDVFQVSNGHVGRRKDMHPSVFTPKGLRQLLSDFSEVTLYDAGLMDYQREKIGAVNSTVGELLSHVSFDRLPKIVQPSIIAMARK
jgi:SAM-dependent methyltransferase